MTNAHLQSIVSRIENLEEERKALGGDIRDIYKEAKGKNYNVKALRKLINERKQDAAERAVLDAAMDAYRHELGMAVELVNSGLSLRKASRQTGVSKSSIHRALTVPDVSQPAGDGTDESRSPEAATSAATPEEPAVVPTGNEGRAGERDTFTPIAGDIPAFLDRRRA